MSRSLSETFFRTTFAIAVKTLRICCFGKLVLLAEARLGELFNQMPKNSGGDRKSEDFKIKNDTPVDFENDEMPKPKLETARDMGFSKDQVSQFQTLADIQKPYKTLSQNLQKPAFLSGEFFYRRFSEKLKKSASVIIAPLCRSSFPYAAFHQRGGRPVLLYPPFEMKIFRVELGGGRLS